MAKSLAWFVDQYVIQRDLAPKSAYQVRRSCRLFEGWAGQIADVASIDERTLSQWLAYLEQRLSQRSCWNHRTNVLAVLRWAADCGARDEVVSRRVRPIRRPRPCPVAWTREELHRLLIASRTFAGIFRTTGASRSLYLSTLIRAAYDTGLRRSDLWRLTRDQVRPDGSIVLTQHKTGWPHRPRLRQAALTGFLALPGQRPLACPYACDSDFYRLWRQLIARAGIRPGALQQLRRTGATHLAVTHPDAVQHYLGHRTETMRWHYIDLSIADPLQYLPPDLEESNHADDPVPAIL